jgi:hypothetical protein
MIEAFHLEPLWIIGGGGNVANFPQHTALNMVALSETIDYGTPNHGNIISTRQFITTSEAIFLTGYIQMNFENPSNKTNIPVFLL